jgi:hypothetical protein
VHEEERWTGDLVDGVFAASTSVATFIRIIAAAPRSTARLSPLAVATAPRTRASAPTLNQDDEAVLVHVLNLVVLRRNSATWPDLGLP